MEVSIQPRAPVALTPGKNPQYPLDMGLAGPKTGVGAVERITTSCPYQKANPDFRINSESKQAYSTTAKRNFISIALK
jgi:hypothetical protein